jgi:hypothetical protein
LKAHDPKIVELGDPISIDMESRDRLGIRLVSIRERLE